MFTKFLDLIRRCYRLAAPYGRRKLLLLLVFTLSNGLFQVIGVTSIFPFLALAADPERFRQSSVGRMLLGYLPLQTNNQLLVAAGILAIVMLLLANLMGLLSEVVRVRYAQGFGHWLRCSLLEQIVARPYGYFLQTNSGGLMQKMCGDVMSCIQNVFLPITEALSRIVTLAFLMAGVVLVSPKIAAAAALGLGFYYGTVFLLVRPRARAIGQAFLKHNTGQMIAMQELLGGIKPILVHCKTAAFIDRVRHHSARLAPLSGRVTAYASGPRYLMEPLAFGGLVAVVVVLALKGRPFSDILPSLAVLALAGYRMLPTVQLIYLQFSTIAAYVYTLKEVEAEVTDISTLGRTPSPAPACTPGCEGIGTIPFERAIRLVHATFSYPGAAQPVLHDFSLEIPRNRSIGIAGTTGSGKSTLVDLILGLHRPASGRLMVDDLVITEDILPSWRKMIGYVPQDIFLLDDSLAANIAFGLAQDQIDMAQVRRAAGAAQILSFIEGELPDKFATLVGERGVRLSGGQRQRIGLARALYHRPEILILDEATSALDVQTETAVMQTIRSLQGSITMIIIAHRLSTLEGCDSVIDIGRKAAVTSV